MQIWISGDPECKFSDVLLNCQSLFINLLTQECSPAVCRVRLWRHPTNSALLTMGWDSRCASFLSDLAFALFLSVCLEMSLRSKKIAVPFLTWFLYACFISVPCPACKQKPQNAQTGPLFCFEDPASFSVNIITSVAFELGKSFVWFQQPFVLGVQCTDRAFWQSHRKFSAE